MNLGLNASVEDIANYTPEQLKPEHVHALLDRIAELEAEVEELEAPRCDEDHEQYDDYKEFFDDILRAFEENHGNWPAAEVYDLTLRQAIIEVIERE